MSWIRCHDGSEMCIRDRSRADALDRGVAKFDDLGEVLAGVDVHDRKRQLLGRKGLDGEVQELSLIHI